VQRPDLDRWLSAYGRAWETADADAAGSLFSPDAVYRPHPFREPRTGGDAVAAHWRDATRGRQGVRARPGEPVLDGDRAAVEWWATMRDAEQGQVNLAGILVLRFDREGLCRELREFRAAQPGRIEPFEGWGLVAGGGPVDARDAAGRWIEGYLSAWRAVDPEPVGALFSEDAVYRSHPFRPPRLGREGALQYTREAFAEEGNFDPRFGVPVCEGAGAAVEYWATGSERGIPSTLAGCDILRFDAGGRCRELRDYWHLEAGTRTPPDEWGR
jgi:ketosteroid isomerase-like protein